MILIQKITYIKNYIYNNIINISPYKLITKQKPDLSYIKILRSLCYTLIFKNTKNNKNFNNKSKKIILVNFEFFNNFIIYIPKNNKVIITKDIIIKKKLNYEEDYKLENDYNIFLKNQIS